MIPRPSTPRYDRPARLRLGRRGRLGAGSSGDPAISPELVDEVLTPLGLTATGPSRGTATPGRADNVVVDTTSGTVVVKGYKSTLDRTSIEQEHSILQHLAALDFPSPRLVEGPHGTTLVRVDERWFAAFEHLDGHFHYNDFVWMPRHHLRLVGLAAGALAALHLNLAGFTPRGSNPNGFVSVDGARHRDIDWHLAELERARSGPVDTASGVALTKMVQGDGKDVQRDLLLLEEQLNSADFPRQVIHGDYGPYNLFFRAGEPVFVLDFELARIDWRVADVAKSLQQFGLSRGRMRPSRIHRFVSSYAASVDLTTDERRLIFEVWRFLTLRRVIVCWERLARTGESRWRDEAERKLLLARLVADAAGTLGGIESMGPGGVK